MSNPITANIRYLAAYFGLWLLFALLQVGVFYFALSLDLVISVYDALLFNLLLSVMGLAIWPLVSFSSLGRGQIINTLITHIAGAGVLISLLVFIIYNVLGYLVAIDNSYLHFLETFMLWRVALAVVLYAIIGLNYYVIIYNEEFRIRKIAESDLMKSLKEAELEMLKSQLNPHFIFNSLNSISSLTVTNPEKAQEMVISLSEFLRYSIRPNQNLLIELGDELEAIKQYITIEKVRFGDRLSVAINCDATCNAYLLPPLIIQPLVENAIKYGVHETLEQGEISINCVCKNNLLEVTVKNTYDNTLPATKTGIGLKNVANRLKLMYGVEELLKVSKNESNFVVNLIIPQKS